MQRQSMPPSFARLAARLPDAARRLERWFIAGHRDAPWRRTRDPYRIWVSEIMLQQTQFETVKPFYRRFLAAFPTVRALARAPLPRVLKQWEGLGYYSRARNLHRAARQILAGGGGRLPRGASEWEELPGVGRYTAGAVASIALGEPAAILDGNVERVLCRLAGFRGNPRERTAREALWDASAVVARSANPRRVNPAMMELGATVCTPRTPQCPACPIRGLCRARRLGHPESIPALHRSRPCGIRGAAALCARRGEEWLLRLRPETGVWAAQWDVPSWPLSRAGRAAARAAVARALGVASAGIECLPPKDFVFSHYTLRLFPCVLRAGRPGVCARIPGAKWVSEAGRTRVPITRGARELLGGDLAGVGKGRT